MATQNLCDSGITWIYIKKWAVQKQYNKNINVSMPPVRITNMLSSYTNVILILLITLRVGVSVCLTAGMGWDFPNYYRVGTLLLNGQEEDLYQVNVSGGIVGFPISSYLFAPLGMFAPRQSLLFFKAQAALLFAAALFLLFRSIQESGIAVQDKGAMLSAFLLSCLFYEPFWFVFAAGGQSTPFAMFLLVIFYRFYLKGQDWWAALCLSGATLIKPVLAPAALIFVFAGDLRLLRNLMVWLSLAAMASVLLLGWPLHREWLELLISTALSELPPWWNNSSVWGVFYSVWSIKHGGSLDAPEKMQGVSLGIILILKALITVWMFRLVHVVKTQNLERQEVRHHLVSLAILFALVLSDIVWPHYLAFLFVPLIFLIVAANRLPLSPRALVWLILISSLAVQSRFAQRYALSTITEYPLVQSLVAGLFGSGTLILTFILFSVCQLDIIRSLRGLKPVR